jgi:hypothetical protein
LILMLRSQGIPAVFVLGFKGATHSGGGRYEVRQEQAHAWAAALISRENPRKKSKDWHWLSLDPNPALGATNPKTVGGSSGSFSIESLKAMFNKFVVQYTSHDREQVVGELVAGMTSRTFLIAMGFVVVVSLGIWALRRRRQRPATPTESTQWFGRLLAVLATRGWAPGPADTPKEFAQTVESLLKAQPATRHVADVPHHWADAYYEVRFGGNEITADRQAQLEAGLGELQFALTGKRRGSLRK